MAFALDEYTAGVSQTDFTITFSYLSESDVLVYVDGTLKTQGAAQDYIFSNPTTIQFNSGLTGGELVILQRATSQSTRLTDYTAGALTEADLDNDSLQAFYFGQESIDIANRALGRTADGANFDAESKRITSVAAPTAGGDAVNKTYADAQYASDLTAIQASQNAAATSASNAATSETNAATSETNAATSASNAATSETNAATSASNASTSETNASASAAAALASQNAAATSASNASTSETNASTSASNASTSASNASTSETNASASASSASTSETNAAASASTALAAQASASVRVDFSTTTAMADPGAGIVRFNNATIASVTAIAVDATSADTGNPDISDWLLAMNNPTANPKAILMFREVGNPAFFAAFNVTAVTDNTGWLQITVTHLDSNGTLDDADNLVMAFSLSGNDGLGAGDVSGPATSTARAIALWNAADGTLLKDGPALGTSGHALLSGGAGSDPSFGQVNTAGIADNAIGLAQMAHGTDGNLITYDATGAPAAVATGTAGQVLTSNGAGAAPTFQAASGGVVSLFYPQLSSAGTAAAAGEAIVDNCATGGDSASINFDIPDDFVSLVSAVIIINPTGTSASANIDIFSSFAGVGEGPTANTGSDTTSTYNITTNQKYELDVSGILTGLAAKDTGGLRILRPSGGTNFECIGARIRYNT